MTTATDPAFEALLDYIKENRGFDFTGYKRTSLERRIAKRMDAVGIPSVQSYLDHLQVDPDEFEQLFNAVLINVTAFFRDTAVWDFLSTEVIPRILEADGDEPVRVWVAGTASGEEAYSIAMLFAEALGPGGLRDRVKIYATDVDDEALATARQAMFSAKQVSEVPPAMAEKYFDPVGSSLVVKQELRSVVIFGRHDIVQDAPISRVDLLSCRNTLIYLNAETQAKVAKNFAFALKDTGFLVLGKAEMLVSHLPQFAAFDMKHRVFVKSPAEGGFREQVLQMRSADHGPQQTSSSLGGREAAFERGGLPQIVVDRHGSLVQANDRARGMFGLGADDLGKALHELDISRRPVDLTTPIQRATADRRPITLREVRWTEGDGERVMEIEVVPLQDRGSRLLGVSVTFSDITRYRELQHRLERSNEELETAMEELQSSNEELETTNEELQSTNEELETLNEELRSTNEELVALNVDLRQRDESVAEMNAFLGSILASVRTGVAVLDEDLQVRLWNDGATDLWGVREHEVVGRSFLGLDIGLPVADLGAVLRDSLRGNPMNDEIRVDAVNRRGKPIVCWVRCSTMRDGEGRIMGLVVTMEDAASRD